MPYERHEETSFHDWRAGDFEVWGAKLHGADAVIDVLLPLIAVSFGLTAIGIVSERLRYPRSLSAPVPAARSRVKAAPACVSPTSWLAQLRWRAG